MKKSIIYSYKILGVINLTPNSFSDGGFHLDKKKLRDSLEYFLSFKDLIIDIGAESTAPMNNAISEKIEKERIDLFFTVADEINLFKKIKIVSVDTYKLAIFEYFYKKIRERNTEISIIFNDVSGIVDKKLIECIRHKTNIFYIYSATRINSRKKVLDHMNVLKNFSSKYENIANEISAQFEYAINYFKKYKMDSILILDPAFGFSKTYEENHYLLDNFDSWAQNLKRPILVGLSKKSFLRKEIFSSNSKEDSEFVHYFYLQKLKEKSNLMNLHIVYRVHNPNIVPIV